MRRSEEQVVVLANLSRSREDSQRQTTLIGWKSRSNATNLEVSKDQVVVQALNQNMGTRENSQANKT